MFLGLLLTFAQEFAIFAQVLKRRHLVDSIKSKERESFSKLKRLSQGEKIIGAEISFCLNVFLSSLDPN